jgi:hypothetical protein
MRCELVAAAWLALAGCREDICARNSDCDVGMVCGEQGACVVPSPETPDAWVADAPPDSADDAAIDAPVIDAAVDAPAVDAAVPDAPIGVTP